MEPNLRADGSRVQKVYLIVTKYASWFNKILQQQPEKIKNS